jgi:RNA polymerase sigma-70 factor (ECF subfamily)
VDAAHDQERAEGGHPITQREFAALYAEEFDYVWRSLVRLGVSSNDLEDLAQDVFVVVHRRWHTYDPARPLRPWLFGIVFRVVSDFVRRAQHRREVAESETWSAAEQPAAQPPADEIVAGREERQLVASALHKLDINKRAVFVMHEIDGCTMPEIAETLAIGLNTAYSRLRLARQDFARAVSSLRAGTPAKGCA